MEINASVWSMTTEPPEGKRTLCPNADSICDSIWYRLNRGIGSV